MKNSARFIMMLLLAIIVCCTTSAQSTANDPDIQPWPSNGEIYYNEFYAQEQVQLDIIIENQKEGYASFIKLLDTNGELVRCLFAGQETRASDPLQVTTKVPGGQYLLKIGIGNQWYGIQAAFGAQGVYSTLKLHSSDHVIPLEAGYRYTLYIDTSLQLEDAEDVQSETIAYDDF